MVGSGSALTVDILADMSTTFILLRDMMLPVCTLYTLHVFSFRSPRVNTSVEYFVRTTKLSTLVRDSTCDSSLALCLHDMPRYKRLSDDLRQLILHLHFIVKLDTKRVCTSAPSKRLSGTTLTLGKSQRRRSMQDDKES